MILSSFDADNLSTIEIASPLDVVFSAKDISSINVNTKLVWTPFDACEHAVSIIATNNGTNSVAF